MLYGGFVDRMSKENDRLRHENVAMRQALSRLIDAARDVEDAYPPSKGVLEALRVACRSSEQALV